MSEAKILVIEDDADINEVACTRLTRAGYDCTAAYSGSEARLLLDRSENAGAYDCIITDLMLPGISGEQLISELRERGAGIPIIVISARDTITDRVTVLKLGADDYLVKPFDLDELVVRVAAQLRGRRFAHANITPARADTATVSSTSAIPAHETDDSTLRAARWTLNQAARTFMIDQQPVTLTNTEFNIIELLMSHPNTVFTKQQVYELCWGEPYAVDDNTVTAHMSKIRAKLKPSGTESYITTVWGLGFKLNV
ncbi:DNA-binding response regulator [Bifidobacterium hapali]|uniref:DNA-binding response regulator n=1 Tax=Bifidobacterium hapali TaxID=1630172 RepID=A0A261FSM2_9BIFI|nr:response regulator transcription factor [Bifidobacterium hapali]OZG62147.1 DNA-binding response regulator [Bifidobacterium hapali]